ncbi:MAG: FliM/FliN family flagellar motor switch protein [Pseudomonadota bacterium]
MDDLGPGGHTATSGFSTVPIEVVVSVGRARPPIRQLLALQREDVLTLDRRIDDPVEVLVGGRLVARGELTEIDDGPPGTLGVRITEVIDTVARP